MYSIFTGLHALVQNGWQLVGLRLLVGMGVGGEWAVAAAAVAEGFPPRARAAASGLFHASSVLGTYLAVAAGFLVLGLGPGGWTYGFLLGVAPALLVFWVRAGMREPESWEEARRRAAQDSKQRLGRFTDLFSTRTLARHTLLGTALGIIGLATFWGTHIKARNLLQDAEAAAQQHLAAGQRDPQAPERFGLYGMLLATTGGGIGLLSFAPLSQRVGRRAAFLFFHLGGFLLVAAAVAAAGSVTALVIVLPIFGFFTLGMHAGYAVYFPELFPTRLRGTGAGFCFNTARIVAGPVLLGFAWLQGEPLNLGLGGAMMVLGALFLVGAALVLFAPETRGQPLPE
jgi:MFS family permease